MLADTAPHRRLAHVSTAAVSQAELDQVARIVGGTWHEADTSGFLSPLELPGTRAEVSRTLAELKRLPQVEFTMLSGPRLRLPRRRAGRAAARAVADPTIDHDAVRAAEKAGRAGRVPSLAGDHRAAFHDLRAGGKVLAAR